MKLLPLLLAAGIVGCSGLSVQWVASYSTTDLATAIKMPQAVVAAPPLPTVVAPTVLQAATPATKQ